MQPLITYQTELSANIVAFCRFLRAKGLTISPIDEADVLRSLTLLNFDEPDSFRLILRAMIPKNLADQKRFDELYETWWSQIRKAQNAKLKSRDDAEEHPSTEQPQPKPSLKTLRNWLTGNRSDEQEELASYSPAETMTRKDFSAFTEEEVQEVARILNAIARTIATRTTRRYQKSKQRVNFDLRRTMRINMRRGGEIFDLAFRRQRIRKMKLIMLCDVSKSMDLYSRFLIQFIFGFQTVYRRIETFVFSTSLHHVTDALQGSTLQDCLKMLSATVPDWSGGTRIGESLNMFIENYGRRMLDDRTVVLVLSDGWDTGDVELLGTSMAEIQRRSARVIWLNPLAGSDAFEPTVRGMQAALPHIDIFAPAHSIESLRQLANHLKSRKRFR